MKKNYLFLATVFLMGLQGYSQTITPTSFGVTAGYLNLDISSSYQNLNASVSESGFFIGAFAEFDISPSVKLKPGINYGKIEDSDGMLFIPIMIKYYIGESDFNIQAGPQTSVMLDAGDQVNGIGMDGSFGAGYDITENLLIEARYSFELTNRLKSMPDIPNDVKSRINSLFIGLGYKF